MGNKVNCYCCTNVGGVKPIELNGRRLELCAYCFTAVTEFVEHRKTGYAVNITWGGGKIGFTCWVSLRKFILEHNIKEVLEFGTGLSSELMIVEGIDLTSLDTLENHSKLFQEHKHYKNKAKFIHYERGNIPELGRTWPLVIVDGPNKRGPEVRAAMKYSNRFIHLHDPNLGEQSFFPNEEWKEIRFKFYGKSN